MATRRVSLSLPQRAVFAGVFDGITGVVDLARLADESGAFDAVWVSDGLLANPHPESLSVLAALSTATERVGLGVACLGSMAVRDPILLAVQLATIDQLSRGRLIVTACLGINKREGKSEREGALYGVADKERVARVEEHMVLLRRLWTEEGVKFDGRFTSLDDVTVLPRPFQTTVPLYLSADPLPGESAERRLRRVARLADGWVTTRKSFTATADNWRALSGYLREEGRDPESFPVVAWHNVNVNPDRSEALDETRRFCKVYHGALFSEKALGLMAALGSVDQVVEHLEGVFREGVNHIMLRPTAWDWRRQTQILIDEIVPALRANGS
jgi:alkanesulfonate monooxygenase SsuD/methylene tetrahydromethanopterin reductase-like flavin-dependent oxidoreductase (luciferase family)